MQGHFANRDKTGTVRLSGWEVMLGWLVCLGERKSPVDPRRDPRTEKTGRKQWSKAYLRVRKSCGKPALFSQNPSEGCPIESSNHGGQRGHILSASKDGLQSGNLLFHQERQKRFNQYNLLALQASAMSCGRYNQIR